MKGLPNVNTVPVSAPGITPALQDGEHIMFPAFMYTVFPFVHATVHILTFIISVTVEKSRGEKNAGNVDHC